MQVSLNYGVNKKTPKNDFESAESTHLQLNTAFRHFFSAFDFFFSKTHSIYTIEETIMLLIFREVGVTECNNFLMRNRSNYGQMLFLSSESNPWASGHKPSVPTLNPRLLPECFTNTSRIILHCSIQHKL